MSYQQVNSVSTIHQETNTRIYDRNLPSQMLQPYISVRPVMTKYSYMPIVDPRKELSVTLEQMPTYNVNKVFNPGNDTAPWSGYSSNVNVESELRNQFFALQKCSQAVYVPNSQSDLYTNTFHNMASKTNNHAHSLLFRQEHFDSFDPNPNSKVVGAGIFHNSTRSQLGEMM